MAESKDRYELIVDLTNMVGEDDQFMIVFSPSGNSIRIYNSQLLLKDCENSFMLKQLMKLDNECLLKFFRSCRYIATRAEMVELLSISRRRK